MILIVWRSAIRHRKPVLVLQKPKPISIHLSNDVSLFIVCWKKEHALTVKAFSLPHGIIIQLIKTAKPQTFCVGREAEEQIKQYCCG